jgi:predicted nucleic-acid-binding protein
MKRQMIRGAKQRRTVMTTVITTLLSATAAVVAIKAAKKISTAYVNAKREDKSELETVLDGLVEAGTITQAQEDAIQSAVIAAKEAAIVNGDFTNGDNGELETVLDSSKIGTLTKLKNSLSKVRSQELKKPAQEMAI